MSGAPEGDVRRWIRTIPDFPKKGIMFRDAVPLCADRLGFRTAVEQLSAP